MKKEWKKLIITNKLTEKVEYTKDFEGYDTDIMISQHIPELELKYNPKDYDHKIEQVY